MFMIKLLVVFSTIMAALFCVNGQIGTAQIIALLRDVNGTSANMSATLPQLATLLKNQADIQILGNFLLENNTAAADEVASILSQIQTFLHEQLERQNMMIGTQQEHQDASLTLLQSHQNTLDWIASSLYEIAQLAQASTDLTKIIATGNKTLAQIYDTLIQAAVTLNQTPNTLTQIGATQTQMFDSVTKIASTQTQMLNTMTWTAATQNQTSNTLSQIGATQSQIFDTLTQIATTQTQMSNIVTQTAASQNQTSNTLSQISDTLTEIATTQTQVANTFNQMVGLLEMQGQQLQNMNSVLSVLEKHQVLMQDPPRHCSDLASKGYYPSAPYTFDFWDGLISYGLYCDMETDAGGWSVVQR